MTSINMLRGTMPVEPLFESDELLQVALAWLATMTSLAGVMVALT